MKSRLHALVLSGALIGGLAPVLPSLAETMVSAQELRAEPRMSAASTGRVSQGQEVEVLAKKGFWVQVTAAEVTGWTKLNHVKTQSSSVGLASLETGRKATGNIVSSTGVRGLDGGDLEKAQPNPKEFAAFSAYAQDKKSAAAFAKSGQLKPRTLSYLNAEQYKKSKKGFGNWLNRK